MSALLEIRDLVGGYEKGQNILEGVDLKVLTAEAVGVIGLNGSGKSTLVKAMMNIIPYRQGTVFFDGQDVHDKNTHELAQMGMAILHQGGTVFPNLSVWQNLSLAWGNNPDQEYRSRLEQIIPILHQPQRELTRVMSDRLSGGQRHELALAMTLARKPKLIILDEPSAGLSPKTMEEMYAMLAAVRNWTGMAFVIVEQNISNAVAFCDRCVMLGQGKIIHEFVKNDACLTDIENIMFKN